MSDNTLPGNPYEDYTSNESSVDNPTQAIAGGANLQAAATLALAYEQRTANLIAIADRVGTRALMRLSEEDYEEIGRQLRTRLGLDQP